MHCPYAALPSHRSTAPIFFARRGPTPAPAPCEEAPTGGLDHVDLKALANDLKSVRSALRKEAGVEDARHLSKMVMWTRLCHWIGLATAWILPNPISIFLISHAKFSRWTMISHHILHRGYDRIEGVEESSTSKRFARGWRRYIDWFDWILPEAWVQEHNFAHHYHLGEQLDPDRVELNLDWLRTLRAPTFVKLSILLFFACTWKVVYWPISTLKEQYAAELRRQGKRISTEQLRIRDIALWNLTDPMGRRMLARLLFRCLLPYALWTFVVLPLLYWPLGTAAVVNVALSMVLAEMLTNIHGFVMLTCNHTGDDLYKFEQKLTRRDEFYLRQIIGSTNYTTGGDLHDFFHGWLNYQIEHHVWPDLTLLQYRKAQPMVKAVCEKHGVPYVQENIWERLKKTVRVMTGEVEMRHWAFRDAPLPQAGEAAQLASAA